MKSIKGSDEICVWQYCYCFDDIYKRRSELI